MRGITAKIHGAQVLRQLPCMASHVEWEDKQTRHSRHLRVFASRSRSSAQQVRPVFTIFNIYAYCIGIHAQFYTLHMSRQENRVGGGKRVDSIPMSQEMQVALNSVSPADFQCDLRYM
jgi:hypothetical protein